MIEKQLSQRMELVPRLELALIAIDVPHNPILTDEPNLQAEQDV